MKNRMKCNGSITRNKRMFLFVIKIVLWLFISYFIIQLSIGAKETEEKKNIPGLQTTMELTNQYMKGKYWRDWRQFGSKFNYPDAHISSSHYLELSSDAGMLLVSPYWGEDYQITQIDMKKGNNNAAIWIFYKTDLKIKVSSNYKGNYAEYDIEFEDGKYIQNPQMEQEISFTTEEIVEQADKIRNAFEEEMEKMHQYQIGRAKERRKKFTNFGFVIFLLFCTFYSIIKWAVINKRANAEDKYLEEVLKETMEKEKEKLLKRRYLLSGCGTAFGIYILKSIISGLVLLSLEGTAREYAAYSISAVITAVIFGLFWKSFVGKKSYGKDAENKLLKRIFQFLSGCIATLIMIQLGVVLVPRFYTFEWRFFKINFLADGIAFFVFIMIEAAKRPATGIDHDDMVEKGV